MIMTCQYLLPMSTHSQTLRSSLMRYGGTFNFGLAFLHCSNLTHIIKSLNYISISRDSMHIKSFHRKS